MKTKATSKRLRIPSAYLYHRTMICKPEIMIRVSMYARDFQALQTHRCILGGELFIWEQVAT